MRERREKGLAVCQRKLVNNSFLELRIMNCCYTAVSAWYQIHELSGLESVQRAKEWWRHKVRKVFSYHLVLCSCFVWMVYRDLTLSVVLRWCSKSFAGNETPVSFFFFTQRLIWLALKHLFICFIQYLNYAYGRHMDLNSTWLTICW